MSPTTITLFYSFSLPVVSFVFEKIPLGVYHDRLLRTGHYRGVRCKDRICGFIDSNVILFVASLSSKHFSRQVCGE